MSAPLSATHEDFETAKVDHDQPPVKSVVHVQDMTAEDRAYELKRALEADPGIPIKSFRFLQLAGMMLIVCMCGGDAGGFMPELRLIPGFDGTVMSSVNSMMQFQNYFGLNIAEKSTGLVFVSQAACLLISRECIPLAKSAPFSRLRSCPTKLGEGGRCGPET
jgi:hypothetical protein